MTYDDLKKLALAKYDPTGEQSKLYSSSSRYWADDIIKKYVKGHAKKTIDRYYLGWEMDNAYWIMTDNTIISTSHGSIVIENAKSFKHYVDEMTSHAKNLEDMLNIINV